MLSSSVICLFFFDRSSVKLREENIALPVCDGIDDDVATRRVVFAMTVRVYKSTPKSSSVSLH